MSTVAQNPNPEDNARVKAVFDDIRATRKSDFINNHLALSRLRYRSAGKDLGRGQGGDGDAVGARSADQGNALYRRLGHQWLRLLRPFPYRRGKRQGHDADQHADLLRVISLAAKTNQLATALQVPGRSRLRCRPSALIAAKSGLAKPQAGLHGIKEERQFWPFGAESLH